VTAEGLYILIAKFGLSSFEPQGNNKTFLEKFYQSDLPPETFRTPLDEKITTEKNPYQNSDQNSSLKPL